MTNKRGRPAKKVDNSAKKVDMSDEAVLKRAKATRLAAKKHQDGLGALDGQRLVAKQRKGYIRRWVNGSEQRLDALLKKGYSFVKKNETAGSCLTTDIGSAKSQIVGQTAAGSARRDYLMEIPEELHAEDQKIKEQRVQTQANSYSGIERNVDELATKEGRSEIYKPL